MNRLNRKNTVREKLDRKTILKDETTDRPQRKKKFLTKKKRKKLCVLTKKNTLMVGMFKNGAKSKEIYTATPALTASNKARLQGDVLKLLNGESKTKDALKNRVICHDKEKALSEISPKKLQQKDLKDPYWSPETRYKAFCTTTAANFKDEKFMINKSAVTDYVQKIKKNLRQFYTDAFHHQILQQKAKNENSHCNMGALGLVHALDPSSNINFENVEVPACSNSKNSESLLKTMNNIHLDSGQANKEFVQTNARINTGVHLFTPNISIESQINRNKGFFPSKSDLYISDLKKHYIQENKKIMQVPTNVNKLNSMPCGEIFQDDTSFEDSFEPLNVRSSTDAGKEMIMKRYLKCIKKHQTEQISFKDNMLEPEQTDIVSNISAGNFIREINNKKIKNIPHSGQYSNYCKKAVHHSSNFITTKEDPNSVQLMNRNPEIDISEVNFERLSNEPLMSENTKIDYVIKKYKHKAQIPLVNSQHFLTPNVFQNNCLKESPDWEKSSEIHIPSNKNLITKDLKGNTPKSREISFLKDQYLKPQTRFTTCPRKRNEKRHTKNMLNTINSLGSGTLTTSSICDFNRLKLFEDSVVRSDDPLFTPKSSQNVTNYFNYSNFQNSEFDSIDCHSNFEQSLDFHSNSKLHLDRKPRHASFISKNKHSESKRAGKHYIEDDLMEKEQESKYTQNSVKKIHNSVLKTSHPLVKNISEQRYAQYLPQYKDSEENNPIVPIPVVFEDKQQNGIYTAITQRVIQPSKYLAVAQSETTQQRIPLYLQVTDQNIISELPQQTINVQKSCEGDKTGALSTVLVPKDKVNGKVTLIPAMQVASHNLLPVYYKTSEPNEYSGKNCTKLIPVNVSHQWQPQLENQKRFVDGNVSVNVPNYYVLHNADNENLVYRQCHYNC